MTQKLQEVSDYTVESTVYEPDHDYPSIVQDRTGYEYKVFLMEGETVVDSWDSLHRYHNGTEYPTHAIAQIGEDVKQGFAYHWFSVPRE